MAGIARHPVERYHRVFVIKEAQRTIHAAFQTVYRRVGAVACIVPAVLIASCTKDAVAPVPDSGDARKGTRMIYRDANGRELTEADLANAAGTVNWSITGGGTVSRRAQELHQQARVAGGSGDYKKALSLLEQASKEAPDWPYPPYDAGFTYLLAGDADKALENYEDTLRLAPRGFFTAMTAVDTLRREKKGDLPPGTYKQFVEWDWIEDPAAKKRAVENRIRQTPTFAPAYKELASLLDDDAARLQTIEKGLSQKPDAETRGFLLVNKSLILSRQSKKKEAVEILGDLILNPATPTDIEQIAKVTLAEIRR